MISTMVRLIIDEIGAIFAIGFSGIDCDVIIVIIVLDITHVQNQVLVALFANVVAYLFMIYL